MNKNRFSKIMLMTVIFMLCLSFPILASTEGTKITINTNDGKDITYALNRAGEALLKFNEDADSSDIKVAANCSVSVSTSDNGDATSLVLFEFDGTSKLTFHDENYNKLNRKDAKKVLTAFINALKDSSISSDSQQSIMDAIVESNSDVSAVMLPLVFDNTKADIFTAYKWLAPFLQVVRVIFGLGAIVVILFAISTTIIDLAFIGLPMWRESTTEKNGGKKPFGVSYEALSTVMAVEKNLESYQNAYLMYLKRRVTTYIVLSVAILWLVAGEMSGLIGWVLNLASGIVE